MKVFLRTTSICALLAGAASIAWSQSPNGPWTTPRVAGLPNAAPTNAAPIASHYQQAAPAGYPLMASRGEPLFAPPPPSAAVPQTLPPAATYSVAAMPAAPAIPSWSSVPAPAPHPGYASAPLVASQYQPATTGYAYPPAAPYGYMATAMNTAPAVGPALVPPGVAPPSTYQSGHVSPMLAWQPTAAPSESLPAPMSQGGTLPSAETIQPFQGGMPPMGAPGVMPPMGAPMDPQFMPPAAGPVPSPVPNYAPPSPSYMPAPGGSVAPNFTPSPAPLGNYAPMPYSGSAPSTYSLPPLRGGGSAPATSGPCGCALDGGGCSGGSCGIGCDTCDDCGVCGPCGMRSSRVFASLAGLYMTRDNPNNVALSSFASEPNLTVLGTSDAGFEWYGGYEAKLGVRIGQQFAIEGVYSWLDEFDESHEIFSPGAGLNSRLDFDGLTAGGVLYTALFDNASHHRVERTNEFHNIEVNLLHQPTIDACSTVGFTSFAGARYFRFDEGLTISSASAGNEIGFNANTGIHDVQVLNQLIGGQFGVRGHWYPARWVRLHATPRMGVFANVVDHHTQLYRGDGVTTLDLYHDKTDVALLGQIDVGTTIYLGRVWSIFATYRAIVVGGVALADDQIPRLMSDTGDITQTDVAGNLILHGGVFGVQAVF